MLRTALLICLLPAAAMGFEFGEPVSIASNATAEDVKTAIAPMVTQFKEALTNDTIAAGLIAGANGSQPELQRLMVALALRQALAADNDLSVKSMDQHWTLMAGMLVSKRQGHVVSRQKD